MPRHTRRSRHIMRYRWPEMTTQQQAEQITKIVEDGAVWLYARGSANADLQSPVFCYGAWKIANDEADKRALSFWFRLVALGLQAAIQA
jgi:hypothetical protein